MKNYREILIQCAIRFLIAIPFFILGWYLVSTAKGGWATSGQILFGMACFVTFAFIIAPPMARLFAEPAGSLYYPDLPAGRPDPEYSIPESLKESGLFEEAISEYEKIAGEHPEEIKPYIQMIDIAVVNLQDLERAGAILKTGLSVLQKHEDRDLLKIMYKTVTSA